MSNAPANASPSAASASRKFHKASKQKLNKSSSETSFRRHPPTSIDLELHTLERDDGKRHSRELSNSLAEIAKKINQVQAKNRRLEEEVSKSTSNRLFLPWVCLWF
jgi:hypothetical protein